MQIFVRNLSGKDINYDVETSDTVKQLKERIEDVEGIPACKMRLIFSGGDLKDDKTLEDHNISKEDTIHLVLRLKGC